MAKMTAGMLVKALSKYPEDTPVMFLDGELNQLFQESSVMELEDTDTGDKSLLLGIEHNPVMEGFEFESESGNQVCVNVPLK